MLPVLPANLPPGVLSSDIEPPEVKTVCERCGGIVDVDDAIGWVGGDERFCDIRCLTEWAAEHLEDVVTWIQE